MLLDIVISFTVSMASPRPSVRLGAWLAIPLVVAFFAADPHMLFEGDLSTRVALAVLFVYATAGIVSSAIGTALGCIARRAIITAWKKFGPPPPKTPERIDQSR